MTPIPCTCGKGGVRGKSSAAEKLQDPQQESQGQLLSPAQLGGTALVLSQDCLGKWEGFPVKSFHTVKQRQSWGARGGTTQTFKKKKKIHTHPPAKQYPQCAEGKGDP